MKSKTNDIQTGIHILRDKLTDAVRASGSFLSVDTQLISQELDYLIVQYYSSQKH